MVTLWSACSVAVLLARAEGTERDIVANAAEKQRQALHLTI